jgi:ATP/maltotriose-dependent transcriptional regulator MalT
MDLAIPVDDPYILMARALYGARLSLFEGRPDEALAILATAWEWNPSSSALASELTSTKALALAILGRLQEADEACLEARERSTTIENLVLEAGARAVAADKSRTPDGAELARDAFSLALRWGNVDTFVCLYRSYPTILIPVGNCADLQRHLWPILERANDVGLARRVLDPSFFALRNWGLTEREKEVLNLVARGMTNREIAQELFIAEVTVKVHVRHILRKMGVRTRTEAALRIVQVDTQLD